MPDKRHFYFPETTSWSSITVQIGVGALATGIGVVGIVQTLMGRPITWSGDGELPARSMSAGKRTR